MKATIAVDVTARGLTFRASAAALTPGISANFEFNFSHISEATAATAAALCAALSAAFWAAFAPA
jgi:hypothetical protein